MDMDDLKSLSSAQASSNNNNGRLSLIGIGMGSAEDITLRGLNLARAAAAVYLEHYTAILIDDADTARLEKLIGKPVVLADRDAVESGDVLTPAVTDKKHVALLVVGDPLSATTHCDLIERCTQKKIEVDVVGNASIITAVGCVGLQLYRYGQALSLCFWTDGWQPASYYDRLAANRALGIHTLLLLDIKVKEISDENLARGRKIYEPARYMSAAVGARQLLEIESRRKLGVALPHHIVIAVARLGSPTASVLVARLKDLAECDDSILGAPLHSVVMPGDVQECEADYVLLHKQVTMTTSSGDEDSSNTSKRIVIIDPTATAPGGDGSQQQQQRAGVITRDDLNKSKVSAEMKKSILMALAEGTISA